MPTFKTTCKIQNEDGIKEVTIYVRDVNDEDEAERNAKYFFLDKPNTCFYSVVKCEKI